jgi:hypothetical protein
VSALSVPDTREDTPPLSAGPRLAAALDDVTDIARRAPTVDQLELYRDVVEALERARGRGHDLSCAAVNAITRWEKRHAIAAPPPSVDATSRRTSR